VGGADLRNITHGSRHGGGIAAVGHGGSGAHSTSIGRSRV
jgi:hypothetical protein